MDNNHYDYVSDFNQGVAIVVKNNKYGAILLGGREIIPPHYDYISPFNDGFADVILDGECSLLDLSGRICENKKAESLFLQ